MAGGRVSAAQRAYRARRIGDVHERALFEEFGTDDGGGLQRIEARALYDRVHETDEQTLTSGLQQRTIHVEGKCRRRRVRGRARGIRAIRASQHAVSEEITVEGGAVQHG